jgi:hypothetical protein
MAASYALTMPAGYWTAPGRDEFGAHCLTLHHERFGVLSDHECRADAIYAAQDHADELADEASAEAAAAAGGAYEATLDTIHAMVSALIVQPLLGDDEARGEQRAVRAALVAIEAIGKAPVAQQIAKAA